MVKLPPVITIDGPSGSGKSTLSIELAKYLKWCVLESGIIYRILACLFLKNKCSYNLYHINYVLQKLEKHFVYKNGLIYNLINRRFHKKYIMSPEVTNLASKLSTISYVRKVLLIKQRLFLRFPGLVANGRDMGTIIFPHANLKIFLDAKLNIRAQRRMIDFHNKGIKVNIKNVLYAMKKRDDRDSFRQCDPLTPAHDAIIINSDNMNFLEVFECVMYYINKKFF